MGDHAIRGNIIASLYHLKAIQFKHRVMLTQLKSAKAEHEATMLRVERTDEGIISAYILDGQLFCYALEHPHLHAPSGVYICKFEYSPKFERKLYELKDVQGYTEIKHHVGNTMEDTEGCILLGEYSGIYKNKRAVLNSRTTINRLHKALDGEDLLLSIYDFTNL